MEKKLDTMKPCHRKHNLPVPSLYHGSTVVAVCKGSCICVELNRIKEVKVQSLPKKGQYSCTKF